MSFASEGKELFEIMEGMGLDTRPYSGRGMFGKKCIGFTSNNALRDIGLLGVALAESDLSDMAGNVLNNISSDNMGHGTIIYFPHIPYPSDKKEEE